MKNEIINRQVSMLLETLQEQYDVVKMKEGRIPQIEIDILLSNTRVLYEALLQLNKANAAEIAVSKPGTIAEEKSLRNNDTETRQEISEPPVKEEPVAVTNPPGIEAEANPVTPLVITGESNEPDMEATAPVQKITGERAKIISKNRQSFKGGNLFEEATVVGDKFEEKQTFHDRFSKSKEDKSIGEKLQNLPLQDLKKSIGINEKFKFVNELFDGHLQDYNENIDLLNSFKTFAEAENFIAQTLMTKYNWKKESAVCQSLMTLVQRKFNS